MVESERGLYLTCIGSFIPSEIYRAELKFLERKGDGFAPPQALLKDLPRSFRHNLLTSTRTGGRTSLFACTETAQDGSPGSRAGRTAAMRSTSCWTIPASMYCHVRDFNGDGKPRHCGAVAQELEMLIVFLNEGNGQFGSQIVWQKPPVFGHSWFEPVDFNKDGRLDFLVVNGDNGEYQSPTKNYHGIRILLNEGGLQFREAYFYPLNGAYKALARDFDSDGDLDIAAISYFPDYVKSPRESFVYLENKGGLEVPRQHVSAVHCRPLAGHGCSGFRRRWGAWI